MHIRERRSLSVVARMIGRGHARGPQRGKGEKTQGVSVLATRKPKSSIRTSVLYLLRLAERRNHGMKSQEPPRTTGVLQSPDVQGEPSPGAPA